MFEEFIKPLFFLIILFLIIFHDKITNHNKLCAVEIYFLVILKVQYAKIVVRKSSNTVNTLSTISVK